MADPVAAGPDGPVPLHERKLAWARAHPGSALPSNVAFVESLPDDERARLAGTVLRRPTRTLSGVAVVAVMTAPARCPHGRCTYCPGGIEFGSPQSYTGEEPSALRGAQFGYDARRITEERLTTLAATGHATSKVEVILMGGTFPARPLPYQEDIFRSVFEGLNGASAPSLAEAQRVNESATHRCVSLTVETRPDWCDGRILPFLLDAGVTRVEVGLECLRDEVLARVGRAHTVADVIRANREARDRGLKVCLHVMLGLPGMDPQRDREDAARLFADPDLRPDMVKVYPTLVVPGTQLYEEWKRGEYTPYDDETAAAVLADFKALVPPWVRIQRIQRDIPVRLLAAGVRRSNIREIARARLVARGGRCRCLRCREVGRTPGQRGRPLTLTETEYTASAGRELFLAWEDVEADQVAAFLRLRFPSDRTVGGVPDPIIRELKVLGPERAIGEPAGDAYQHRGLGRSLVARAEERARADGFDRIRVMSAVGTREYYRRLGYEALGPHYAKATCAPRNALDGGTAIS